MENTREIAFTYYKHRLMLETIKELLSKTHNVMLREVRENTLALTVTTGPDEHIRITLDIRAINHILENRNDVDHYLRVMAKDIKRHRKKEREERDPPRRREEFTW